MSHACRYGQPYLCVIKDIHSVPCYALNWLFRHSLFFIDIKQFHAFDWSMGQCWQDNTSLWTNTYVVSGLLSHDNTSLWTSTYVVSGLLSHGWLLKNVMLCSTDAIVDKSDTFLNCLLNPHDASASDVISSMVMLTASAQLATIKPLIFGCVLACACVCRVSLFLR